MSDGFTWGTLGVLLTGGAFVVAVFSVAFSIAKNQSSQLIQILERQIADLKDKNNDLERQRDRLSEELAITSAVDLTSSSITGTSDEVEKQTLAPDEVHTEVKLSRGDSAELFQGKLILTLVGISFEGDPLRHRVTATVSSPGGQSTHLNKVDPGESIAYEGYEVRVLSSSTNVARFSIRKLSTPTA